MVWLKGAWALVTGPVGRVLGLIGLALGAYLYAKGQGRREERQARIEQTLEDVQTKQEIEREVESLTEPELEVEGKPWLRP